MINYLSSFTNTNGLSFPDTLSVNASGPSATDGTEFVKLMIDDIWGARQAIMDHASLTPDTVTEAPGTAQIIDALKLGMLGQPAGSLIGWLQNDDPTTFGARVLLLTGQGTLRANYVDLDNAVYVGNTANPTAPSFYHADDAAGTTRNTTGIYLILPDARAMFWRGTGTAGTLLMADGNPYVGPTLPGGSVLDQYQGSAIHIPAQSQSSGSGHTDNNALCGSVSGTDDLNFADLAGIDDGANGTPRTGPQTMSVNLGIRWGISY